MCVCFVYLHSAAVTLLSPLQDAVPAGWRSHYALVVRLVQQAAGAAIGQVLHVVVVAAAAERAGDVPAEERITCCLT